MRLSFMVAAKPVLFTEEPLCMSNPILEVKNLSFVYLKGQPILDQVSFSLEPGDYVGLIGPNGSGKTTLLKLLLGLLPLQTGSITLFDQPLSQFQAWHKLGYIPQLVFQRDRTFPAMVREIIYSGFPRSIFPLTRLEPAEQALFDRIVEIVGIASLLHQRIGELSGGEMQRVAIARALMASPELLILDEPTSGIDLSGEEAFYTLLRELNQKHQLSILLVSHDLEALAHNATSALCLNHHVVYSGPAEGLHSQTVIESVFGAKAWHSHSQKTSL